jgi:hypothetical protein
MEGTRQEANEPPEPWLLCDGAYHKGAGAEDKTRDLAGGRPPKRKRPHGFPQGQREKSCLLA